LGFCGRKRASLGLVVSAGLQFAEAVGIIENCRSRPLGRTWGFLCTALVLRGLKRNWL